VPEQGREFVLSAKPTATPPMEYAVEMNRLIELQMEASIGYSPTPAAAFDAAPLSLAAVKHRPLSCGAGVLPRRA
jgi:hypothetical protein